mmetsp:Transcript_44797/g.81728  ORF Transcript_44797/g.81728 Transcript_44797/m.81728 type:complete len:189 (-) Transcript_44797:31-597(-)
MSRGGARRSPPSRRGGATLPSLFLTAGSILVLWSLGQSWLFTRCPSLTSWRYRSSDPSTRRLATTEEDIFADVATGSAAPKEVPKSNATAEVKAEAQSGKRIRQFLALEPVEDDPSEGNQWAVDSKSEKLSDDESRKKLTAIVTGSLTLFFGVAYFVIVFLAENRDPSEVEQVRSSALSREEMALLGR